MRSYATTIPRLTEFVTSAECHELSQSRHLGSTRAQRWPVRLDCPKYKNLKLKREEKEGGIVGSIYSSLQAGNSLNR